MTIVILGAGRVGLRAAERLTASRRVRASTRRYERFDELAACGAEPRFADLANSRSLDDFVAGASLAIFAAAPGHDDYDAVYGGGIRRFLSALVRASVARLILVTSTSVWDAYDDGRAVDETSPAAPASDRARQLLNAEAAAREALGSGVQVLRLAGLYGRGRGPMHFASPTLEAGRPLSGAGSRALNLIHEDDAAGILAVLATREPEASPPLVLGADGHPESRAERYASYAQSRGFPVPRFMEPDGPLGICAIPRANIVTLRFPTFAAALAAGEA